jgi:hypothetical protein
MSVELAVDAPTRGEHRNVAALAVARGCIVLVCCLTSGCGGSSSSPTPVSQSSSSRPPSTGASVNIAPVIESISASSDRAEVDAEITMTAVVKDEETPIEQLKFDWKADAGTFSGDGAVVKWRAPKGIKTPADFEIRLTVTENYGSPNSAGVRAQNVTTSSLPDIRVHDSNKELEDLSIQFLTDFADSKVPASTCVRDFSDSCRGKVDERGDIEANRTHFDILNYSLSMKSVVVAQSAVSANMVVACSFTSRIKLCDPGDKACVVGDVGTARGDCILTGKYENRRWWLCDSHFIGRLTDSFRNFFGRQ